MAVFYRGKASSVRARGVSVAAAVFRHWVAVVGLGAARQGPADGGGSGVRDGCSDRNRLRAASRNEPQANGQRPSARAVHGDRHLLFFRQQKADWDDDSKFTVFVFGHCNTHE